MNIKKPNSFARYGNDYVAPLTTIDQIVKPSGERYTGKEFELISNVENVMFGESGGGKNLFSGWGFGIYDATGKASHNATVCSIDLIKVSPSTSYVLSVDSLGGDGSNYPDFWMYDKNKNSIGSGNGYRTSITNTSTKKITKFDIPSNCEYIGIYCSYQSLTNNNLSNIVSTQLEKGSTATEYELYIKSLKQLTNSALNMDLLWTNASPTSEFASQTIELDLSEYKLFLFIIYIDTGNSLIYMDILLKGFNIRSTISHYSTKDPIIYARSINITDNNITIGDASVNAGINNIGYIPYQIYGVK